MKMTYTLPKDDNKEIGRRGGWVGSYIAQGLGPLGSQEVKSSVVNSTAFGHGLMHGTGLCAWLVGYVPRTVADPASAPDPEPSRCETLSGVLAHRARGGKKKLLSSNRSMHPFGNFVR
jgi:hypothetical protein